MKEWMQHEYCMNEEVNACMLAVAGWQHAESVTPDGCDTIKSLLDISVEMGHQAVALDETTV